MGSYKAILPKPRSSTSPVLVILKSRFRSWSKKLMNYNIKYKFPYRVSKIFFFISIIKVLILLNKNRRYLIKWKVLKLLKLDLDFCLYVDWVRLIFFRVLCMIVSCVLKFSCIYMERDTFNVRFTWIVLRFVFSMACLIFIPHFFFLLVGWDGLGITRFLLVIYYLSDSSWGAGLKTYLINRIGDRFFIIGLVLFLKKGYWDINRLSEKYLLCLIIVLGCFTKRAQFPFSSWLPAAMAAPTPVSSLVHSSTLVTAGIYLMIRFSYIFPNWLFILIGVRGMWTLYSARLAACCEYDCKKVVAYSTLSQLGLMSVSISLNLPLIAFFHLITHAMFKALIFICVGYLIKKSGHFQDARRLKGLWQTSPLLGITLIIRNFSLLGFPFLAGFFSKELIIENNILTINWVFHILLLLSLPLTSYYRMRLTLKVLKKIKYSKVTPTQDKKVLIFSLVPLYLGAILIGCLLYPYFYRTSSIYPCHKMKLSVSTLILIGAFLRWLDYKINVKSLIWFCRRIRFLVPFNSSYWNKSFRNTGKEMFNLLDQGLWSQRISSIDKSLTSSGSWALSSLKYFSFPKAGYYIGRIVRLLLFLRFIL